MVSWGSTSRTVIAPHEANNDIGNTSNPCSYPRKRRERGKHRESMPECPAPIIKPIKPNSNLSCDSRVGGVGELEAGEAGSSAARWNKERERKRKGQPR